MGGGDKTDTGGTNSNPPLPPQFGANDNWVVYYARIQQFFVAYNIGDANRKLAILLTSLSQEVYEILMDLCFPDQPETKSYKEINEILKGHYTPSVAVYAERRKFYDAQQNEHESVSDYVARLRGLTRHCKFGATFNDVVRDKFVCGLLKGPLFNKAMEMEPTATLEACVEAVIKKEATLEQSSSTSTESIHYVQSSGISCVVCGNANHKSHECRFKGYVCRSCNKKGHLAKMCKEKRNRTQEKAKQGSHHYVELDTNEHHDEDDEPDDERITWSGLH